MKLNLGCGEYRAVDWVNIDCWSGVNPDVVADASHLPYDDACINAVYCGHLLEHLTFGGELPVVLREVRRVLAPDGRACFVGPDYDRALATDEWRELAPLIRDGGNRWPGDEHRWLSTGPKTLEAVLPIFPDAVEVDVTTLAEYWPIVDRVGWQFAILTGVDVPDDETPEDVPESSSKPQRKPPLERAVPLQKETR